LEVDDTGHSSVPDGYCHLRIVARDSRTLELEINDHIQAMAGPFRSTLLADLVPDQARLVKSKAASHLSKRREIQQLL